MTVARNKALLRADRLAEIDAQIADGRLIVRQMTVLQHSAARESARSASANSKARLARSKALRHDQ